MTPAEIVVAARGLPGFDAGPATASLLLRDQGKEVFLLRAESAAAIVKRGPARTIRIETALARLLDARMPGAVPALIAEMPAIEAIALRYFAPADLAPLGESLRAGTGGDWPRRVGGFLAAFQSQCRGDGAIAAPVEENRPLVRETARRLFEAIPIVAPEAAPAAAALLDDAFARRTTLAHGDLSVKHVFVGPAGVALIDLETAWYGDPAFDVGRLVGMTVGQLVHRPVDRPGLAIQALVADMPAAWRAGIDGADAAATEARAVRTALCVMLAVAGVLSRRPAGVTPAAVALGGVARRLLAGGADRFAPIAPALLRAWGAAPDRA